MNISKMAVMVEFVFDGYLARGNIFSENGEPFFRSASVISAPDKRSRLVVMNAIINKMPVVARGLIHFRAYRLNESGIFEYDPEYSETYYGEYFKKEEGVKNAG
jgi:hypothetical protein